MGGGANASGKTAVIPLLKTILGENYAIYDFDDIGVPDNADTVWKGKLADKWLQRLLTEPRDVILVGGVVLGEIVACPHAKELQQIKYCFLDVVDDVRVNRRPTINQDMLNWASWLRMHHHIPHWEQLAKACKAFKCRNSCSYKNGQII